MYFITFILLFIVSTETIANSWELARQEEGIEIYTRPSIFDSGYKSYLGIMELEANLHQIFALIGDNDACPLWLHQCVSSKVIEQISATEKIYYSITYTPWPLDNRESIIRATMTQEAESGIVFVRMKAESTKVAIKNNDLVRAPAVKGYWKLIPLGNGKIRIEYKIDAHPGGSVPQWVVNRFVTDAPFNSLKNMRTMIKKPKYQNARFEFIK